MMKLRSQWMRNCRSFWSVETRIMDSLKQFVDDAMMKVRGEVLHVMTQMLQEVERRCYLKSISEAELLEAYNRRDNIKVSGIVEEVEDGPRGENSKATALKVTEILKAIDAGVELNDISIALWLPAGGSHRPIIVYFSRRSSKIDNTRKTTKLKDQAAWKDVWIIEVLTQARFNFMQLMKRDEIVESVGSREGSLLFKLKNSDNVEPILGLLEGCTYMNHSLIDLEKCFPIEWHRSS